MNCSVEGCHNINEIDASCGDIPLCKWHRERWGDFYQGYEAGHYGDRESVRHGRLNKKRWDKAMSAFLDWCAVEIAACCELAEIYATGKAEEKIDQKVD